MLLLLLLPALLWLGLLAPGLELDDAPVGSSSHEDGGSHRPWPEADAGVWSSSAGKERRKQIIVRRLKKKKKKTRTMYRRARGEGSHGPSRHRRHAGAQTSLIHRFPLRLPGGAGGGQLPIKGQFDGKRARLSDCRSSLDDEPELRLALLSVRSSVVFFWRSRSFLRSTRSKLSSMPAPWVRDQPYFVVVFALLVVPAPAESDEPTEPRRLVSALDERSERSDAESPDATSDGACEGGCVTGSSRDLRPKPNMDTMLRRFPIGASGADVSPSGIYRKNKKANE